MDADEFVKHNPIPGSRSLLCEAHGLAELDGYLKENPYLRVVQVHNVKPEELRLERIVSCTPTEKKWHEAGRGLALMHAIRGDSYGLGDDNFIGLNPQKNMWSTSWSEFFYNYRLLPMALLVGGEALRSLQSRREEIEALLNTRSVCAPLHGDLWSGNILFDQRGAVLIDPAFYWGDPLGDIAMTLLFGGFPPAFYEGYGLEVHDLHELKPLIEIYQLYHVLNHAYLFGAAYTTQAKELLGT
jgi:fructosamine-3-kinase